MDPRTQERVERWDSRPFNGGFDGLRDLAADEFSGAVASGRTWLFMLNGRIVGVVDGAIEDFEDGSGTIYEASHPSLPLLCSMEERGGETQAKYYTNETPLREVDETLQSGSFTGYVELSENVLSGDYYAVYYGGRRMAAAYIGTAERLVTGDEAFERAADEVGIYEVVDVAVDVTDVPSPGPDAGETAGSIGSTHSPDSPAKADPEAGAPAEPDRDTDATAATDRADRAGADADASSGRSGSGNVAGASPSEPERNESQEEAAILEAESDREPTDGDPDRGSASERPRTRDEGPATQSPDRTGITAGTDEQVGEPSSSSGITDGSATSAADGDGTDDGTAATDVTASESPAPADAADRAVDDPQESTTRSEGSAPTADGAPESTPSPEEIERAADELGTDGVPWAGEEGAEEASEPDSAGEEGADDERDERFRKEERWRETRSIPSLDPDQSAAATDATAGGKPERRDAGGRPGPGPSRSDGATDDGGEADDDHSRPRSPGDDAGSSPAPGAGGGPADDSRDGTLESDMLEREDRIDQLTQRVTDLEARRDALEEKATELERERDELRSENQELSATVERLRGRIDELEAELDAARAAESPADAGGSAPSGTALEPKRALTETNLFVRYASKSQPTLETAHEGDADRDDVAGNLQLEHHTQFDATDVTVDGQSYEAFLADTMEYRFVDWLVGTLLYEIRDTGRGDALGDLYDAIPRIDRAELHATISLEDDDTDDVPDEVTFDVVAFDKRGTPLVVANLNDSRQPATKGMLEILEEDASAVCANYPDLGAALVVTSSFFEPGALEVTEHATGGGFLSRSSRLSYVNLSRKQGYHLCLVESRSGGFHVNVPEL